MCFYINRQGKTTENHSVLRGFVVSEMQSVRPLSIYLFVVGSYFGDRLWSHSQGGLGDSDHRKRRDKKNVGMQFIQKPCLRDLRCSLSKRSGRRHRTVRMWIAESIRIHRVRKEEGHTEVPGVPKKCMFSWCHSPETYFPFKLWCGQTCLFLSL